MSDESVVYVYLENANTGSVSFKPKIKGAKWKKASSVYEVCKLLDGVLPNPVFIEYVEHKA